MHPKGVSLNLYFHQRQSMVTYDPSEYTHVLYCSQIVGDIEI